MNGEEVMNYFMLQLVPAKGEGLQKIEIKLNPYLTLSNPTIWVNELGEEPKTFHFPFW